MCFKSDRELYSHYPKPRRRLVIIVPLAMLLSVLFGCAIPIFAVILKSVLLAVLSALLSAACIAYMVVEWCKCNKAEFELCKEAYAYLWNKEFAEGEEFETFDGESGITYTIKREGLKIKFSSSEPCEQVFDEVEENVDFIPWSRTRLMLASQNPYFSAKLALAVLDVGTAQMEEDGDASYEEPFIIPMSERLVCAVKSFGLEEKTCGNWAYLFYNPDDALKQIYKRGYIRVMRDRKTGKIIPLSDED